MTAGEAGLRRLGRDLWDFWSSTRLTGGMSALALAGLLLTLSRPEWLPPSAFFGGRWYTLFLWLVVALNLLALSLRGGRSALRFAAVAGLRALLWRWATSIRLALVLIGLLMGLGLVSTVLPQLTFNRSVDLISRFGPEEFALLERLGLTHLFSSWPFYLLVGAFTVNLTACTVKRLRASLSYVRLPMRPKPPSALARLPHYAQLDLSEGPGGAAWSRVQATLRSKRYRVREQDGQLLAEKWRWERFAIDVFHVSLLVIIGALAVTNTLGYDVIQVNFQGDVFPVPGRDFQVRVDDFGSQNYPQSEAVMDWSTTLTVLEDGQEVKTQTIEVNHPLSYRGISIYQAAMGEDWQGAARVTLQVVRAADGQELGEFSARVGQEFPVPQAGLRVRVSAFLPDFALTENRVAYSRSERLLNPAAYLEVFNEDGQRLFRTWSFSQLPGLQSLTDNPYRFYISGMTAPEFTGLELSWDPGMPVAYVGFVAVVLSLVANFAFKHRQIWVRCDPQTQTLHLGAKARRGELPEEFAALIQRLELPLKEVPFHAQ